MSSPPVSRGHGTVSRTTLPLLIERDEDGFYVVECPVIAGCYTQGKTLDEALKNIEEVIQLLAEEKDVKKMLQNYAPGDLSFHTITIQL